MALPLMAIGLVPLVLLRWRIDLLALSEDEARSLGLDVTKLRLARHRVRHPRHRVAPWPSPASSAGWAS